MERPRTGIGIFVIRNNEDILLGVRKGSHGEGEYALPGGHLEYGESFSGCVYRELAEEVGEGFLVEEPELLCVTNLQRYMPKHYVDLGMLAVWKSGDPVVMEPNKIES
jgi:8-oxo-dGTP diphosphatase